MLGAAEANPESFLRAYEDRVILDEVQMVPDLFRVLKLLVDEVRIEDKQRVNGCYLLTGSANIMALPKLSDALVGRMRVLTLYPLSALEISRRKGDFLTKLMSNSFKPTTFKRNGRITDIIKQATFPEITDEDNERRRQTEEDFVCGIVLYRGSKIIPFGNSLWAVPADAKRA